MTNSTSISPLRRRMIEDMTARALGRQTQRGHILACKRFAAYLKRSADTATAEDVRLFQLHLMESGLSIQTRNRTMTGLRFLLRVTMRRLDLAAEIYHMKEPQRIPQILSAGGTAIDINAASISKPKMTGNVVAHFCGGNSISIQAEILSRART
jgi:site-specific recombinase XerD